MLTQHSGSQAQATPSTNCMSLAVLISVIALVYSDEALNVTREQAQAAEREKRPYLTAEMRPQLNASLALIASRVEIVNYGKLARNLQMKVYEFLEVEWRSCQVVCKQVQAAILFSISPTRCGRPFS